MFLFLFLFFNSQNNILLQFNKKKKHLFHPIHMRVPTSTIYDEDDGRLYTLIYIQVLYTVQSHPIFPLIRATPVSIQLLCSVCSYIGYTIF